VKFLFFPFNYSFMAKQTGKPQPKTEKKSPPKPEIVLIPLIPQAFAKKIFFGLGLAMLLTMVTVSHQFGISGDEYYHSQYGHHIVNFYATLGKDTTAVSTHGADSLMVFYGGFYDGTATLLSKALPSVNEWDVRHCWNSIFGFLAMFCAGLVAVEVAGWQAGILTLLFMFFSPRFFGESMNNPKDITMTTGYMFAYIFIIKFLKQLPRPSLKTALGLGASIAVAMGIRIGGLLLIPYAFMFYGISMLMIYGRRELFDFSKFKDNVWPSLRLLLMASVIGYFGSLIFWPYGMMSPFKHPLEVLAEAQKYPVQIRILFDGKHIMSTEVPWNYIPQWLVITTPLFGLIGLIFSFGLIPSMRKRENLLLLAFLYFTLVFPIAFVIYKKSVLYDSMRHLFFVYPSIVILAGLAFDYLLKVTPRNGKFLSAALILVLLFLPARFMFANHPDESVYFNELEGGIKGAFGNYETDYYMNSVKQCADWLKTHEDLKRTDGRRTSVFSNAIVPVNQYFKADSAFVSPGYISYRNRTNAGNGDYMIMYCRFIDRNILVNGAFPPEQTVYTVYADGVPLSCVVKKTDHGDYIGQELMAKNDYAGAMAVLEPYAQKYPLNDVVLSNLGLCYLSAQRYDDAIRVLGRAMTLNSENMNSGYYMGMAYMYKGQFADAATVLTAVVKDNPYFGPPYRVLSECMRRLGDQNAASSYMNMYRQLGGR